MEQEMQGNSILFIVAGHHTTATSLAFLLYDLALAPEIQDRVVVEIAEVLPNKVWNVMRNLWCSLKNVLHNDTNFSEVCS